MTLRRDIRVASALKEANGSLALGLNPYTRVIWHTGHNEFVLISGNGGVYTLADISSKVQQAPGITAPGLLDNDLVIQDYRDNSSTLISDNVTMAIDDGNLDNWVVGGASTQNTNIMFTLPGDGLLYKVEERVSFSNDNYVADQTLGVNIFDFPGVNCFDNSSGGNRIVVAQADQVGFINSGDDPNVVANWNVQDFASFNRTLTGIALNDAGTLAIMMDEFGEMARWNPGGAVTKYTSAQNPFSMVSESASNARLGNIAYSSFWGGYIILSSAGKIIGFVDESNPTEVQTAMWVGFTPISSVPRREKYPPGAFNPTNGQGVFATNSDVHELGLVTPP